MRDRPRDGCGDDANCVYLKIEYRPQALTGPTPLLFLQPGACTVQIWQASRAACASGCRVVDLSMDRKHGPLGRKR
jgi:hypothetical protein